MRGFSLLTILLVLGVIYVQTATPQERFKIKGPKESSEPVFCFDLINKGVAKQGDTCLMKIVDAFPTQLPIGYVAAACKRDKLEELAENGDFFKQLEKKPVPVVIGPYSNHQHTHSNSSLYITDHHHLIYAIFMMRGSYLPPKYSDITERYVYATIQRDYSTLSKTNFWNTLIKNNLTYTYDEFGKPLHNFPDSLPSSVMYLKNDPFRSLAYFDRRQGGYGKIDQEFQEFSWANYLRANSFFSPLNQYTDLTSFDMEAPTTKKLIPAAVYASQQPDAKNLPGFGHGKRQNPECKYFK
ncbi:predicted protein [Naegleria gruberi]|uniref:Predicted protein n=1 Tax=Naegleria gruberi TaxID=5762 RepID=D2VWN8_NAEGR|nr:uncharacterized protein NAEGRDRAFT_52852 [Naegleria gruberi]EFC38728.1 predicted protein [Naegleria gruberi]|eukprot:XP_002671472.1 predicted protein [Naegleria gruberi strain NEG-M]